LHVNLESNISFVFLKLSVILLMSFPRQMYLKFIEQILSPLHSWVHQPILLLCPHFRHKFVLL